MNCLPVIIRELHIAAQHAFTYYGRSLTALAAILIILQLLFGISTNLINPSRVGGYLYAVFSLLGYLYCLFVGVLVTADCISREKRDGTLGLLYLTELNSFDIVIGKMFSRGIRFLGFLLATAPVPALTFFLGGVQITDFLWLVLAQVNTLFYFSALGILISAFCTQSAFAICLSLGSGLLIGILIPAFILMKIQMTGMSGAWIFALLPMPAGAVLATLAPGSGIVLPWEYGFSASWILVHAEAWMFLFAASFFLYRQMRRVPSSMQQSLWFLKPVKWPQWKSRKSHVPKLRREKVEIILELIQKQRSPAFWLHGIFIAVGFVFLANRYASSASAIGIMFILGVILIYFMLEFDLARQSCRFLSEISENGLLELILTTPISVEELIRGHMLYLRENYVMVTQTITFCCLLMLASGTILRGFNLELFMGSLALWLVISAIHIVDMYALSWIGLWQGLKQKQVNRALNRSLLLVMVMPWLVFLAGFVWIYTVFSQQQIGLFGFLWLLGSRFANHAFWCAWAINQLYDQFHEMAIAHAERTSA